MKLQLRQPIRPTVGTAGRDNSQPPKPPARSESEDRVILVGPRTAPDARHWEVVLVDAGNAHQHLPSVGSYAEALARAVDNDCGFYLPPDIEQDMTAHGVGPRADR